MERVRQAIKQIQFHYRRQRHGGPAAPLYLFNYHKVGTKLLGRVFSTVADRFGWRFTHLPGWVQTLPAADVVQFMHSQLDRSLLPDAYRGLHLIRDPRDVIVSGYLYHLRTNERWCTNEDFNLRPQISFPQIPHSQVWRSREWKQDYLHGLQGQSYQKNLQQRQQEEGLLFEMHHYGRWTIEDMVRWDYSPDPRMLEIRFEDLMASFDEQFQRIFRFLGLNEQQQIMAMQLAAREDLSRKTDEEIAQHPHISARQTSKWQAYFTPALKAAFLELFGDALVHLGYEQDDDW